MSHLAVEEVLGLFHRSNDAAVWLSSADAEEYLTASPTSSMRTSSAARTLFGSMRTKSSTLSSASKPLRADACTTTTSSSMKTGT